MRHFKLFLVAIILHSSLFTFHCFAQAEHYEWHSLPFGGGGFVTGLINSPAEPGLMYARTDVGGAFRWQDETSSWVPITDWAGEDQCGYLGVESIAIDPTQANVVYLYLGTSYWNWGLSGIFRSEDYGETFKRQADVTQKFPAHGNGVGRAAGEMLAVCPWKPDMLVCGSRTRGVWRSMNQGKTWTRVGSTSFKNDQKVAFVQFVEHDSTIYVGLQVKDAANLFVSHDEGRTWAAVEWSATEFMPHRATLSRDSLLYVACSDSQGPSTGNSKGAIMRLNTHTGEWTDISPEHLSFGDVAVSEQNPDWLVTSTYSMWRAINWVSGKTQWGDQVFVSKNGGKTWTNLMSTNRARFSEPLVVWAKDGTAQLHWCGSIRIDPFNTQRAFFISGNGIFVSDNIFAANPKFRMAVTGLEETVPTSLATTIGGPVITTLGDVDGCVYEDVHTYYKKHTPAMGTTGYCCIAAQAPDIFARLKSNSPQIYLTENRGRTWKEIKGPATVTDGHSYQYAALSADGRVLMTVPYEMKPIYTTDRGKTWHDVPGQTAVVAMHGDGLDPDVFYIYTSGKLYTYRLDPATDEMTYTTRVIADVKNDRTMAVVPGRAGDLWMARGSSGLAHVTDAHTVKPTVKNITLSYVTCVGVGAPREADGYPALYIWGKPRSTNKTGLYRSDDEGKTWTRINDDQHQFGGPGNAQFVKGDMNVYGRVYMSTVGRGVICGTRIEDTEDGIERPTSDPSREGRGVAGVVYDLAGREIVNLRSASGDASYLKKSSNCKLTRGLYIIGGKKVCVK